MAAMTQAQMIAEINGYLLKLEAGGLGGEKISYVADQIAANGTTTIDAPALLEFTTATHYHQSTGIQLRIEDPTIPTNPPIIDASAVLKWEIQTDGKILIRSNYNGVVKFYLKLTMPVKRP
uniref:Uncharacterized protein n=1 Tax=Pseudomonas phage RVTF4 TaxID=3236931 RepID=A0AB39CDG1_9VIRU